MATKRKSNRTVIFIVALVLVLFLFQGRTGLILDAFQIYDDFETGFRSDLWQKSDSSVVTVSDGQMVISGESVVNSIKLFGTEDIRIKGKIELIWQSNYCGNSDVGLGASITSGGISYGDKGIGIPATFERCANVGNLRHSDYSGSFILEIKRFDDLDTTRYVVVVNGEEIDTGSNDEPEAITFSTPSGWHSSKLIITQVSYEPFFSCVVDYDSEVIVRDKFSSGSEVNLNNLKFSPLKFCPTDLGVLIISEDGLTDEKGSITKSIAEGETLIIPDDQYWQIDYITKFVDNMTERCEIGEVYATFLDPPSCISVATQQIPTQELLFCEKTDDCIVPQKCNDVVVECTENQCNYESAVCTPDEIINFIEVIKTIKIEEPEIIIIKETQNDIVFTFEDGIIVAGREYSITEPIALRDETQCQVDRGEFLSTSNDGCYSVNIEWGDLVFTLKNGQTKTINDNLELLYELEGSGVFNGVFDDVDYDYEFIPGREKDNVFKVTFTDIFDINIDNYQEKVLLNADNSIDLTVTNNLWDLDDAGYAIKISKGIIDEFLPTDTVSKSIPAGESIYNINLTTDVIGIHSVEISLLFDMLDNKIYNSNKRLSLSYFVSDDPEVIDCFKTGCEIGECQPEGICLLKEDVDCNERGCTIGDCQSDGTCLVEKEIDCHENDCTLGECQPDGNCLVTEIVEKEGFDKIILLIIAGIVLFLIFRRKE